MVWTALASLGVSQGELIQGVSLEDSDGTLPNPNMTPTDAIDGTGLSSIAFDATHSMVWRDHWYSSQRVGAFFTADLGENYALDTIHVWNENENNAGRQRGLQNVEILVSPDGNTDNLVKLVTDGSGTTDNETGDFLFPIGEGVATYTGFAVDLSSVTNADLLNNVRLVRIVGIDNYGGTNGSGLAEVQFG